MLRIILVGGGFALTLYCLIDLWQTRKAETETLPARRGSRSSLWSRSPGR